MHTEDAHLNIVLEAMILLFFFIFYTKKFRMEDLQPVQH